MRTQTSRKLQMGALSASLFCITASAFAADATVPNDVTYKNQRGSKLVLVGFNPDEPTGSLSGTFTTAVGNCKEDMNKPTPIAGFYNGNAFSITVNFPHCKQVVAMTGHFTEGGLHTLWLDAGQVKDPETSGWNANIVGTDVYQKDRP